VPTAEKALELLRTANYDLLITDLVMEGVNGIDLIQTALKEQLVDRDHLFVVTGLPKTTLLVESLKKSGIRVLPKPFTAKQFTHAMKSIAHKSV
jgi:DNA-binding response OmpR family regulator